MNAEGHQRPHVYRHRHRHRDWHWHRHRHRASFLRRADSRLNAGDPGCLVVDFRHRHEGGRVPTALATNVLAGTGR